MAEARILFVDNDSDFLSTWKEFLEEESYVVLLALDVEEAENILRHRHIDLCVIDVRLINDDDPEDNSGLSLAKRVAPEIPKIILTRFPTYRAAREALAPHMDGLPPAVEIVAKQDGPQALITAIRRVLKLGDRFYEGLRDISERIQKDYDDARQQARVNFWSSLSVSLVGIAVIFTGMALALAGAQAIGLTSTLAGVVVEAVGFLFFRRADRANSRMDEYHKELLETRRFDNLLAACDALLVDEGKEDCKERVIATAAQRWFLANSAQAHAG